MVYDQHLHQKMAIRPQVDQSLGLKRPKKLMCKKNGGKTIPSAPEFSNTLNISQLFKVLLFQMDLEQRK